MARLPAERSATRAARSMGPPDRTADQWRRPSDRPHRNPYDAGATHPPLRLLSIWRWRRQGPPTLKIGRRVMYRPVDVRNWIDAHEIR